LGELVELRVSVEQAGGDVLIKDADGEGWEEGEEDIVEGQGPGFEYDLPGKGVLEGVLRDVSGGKPRDVADLPRTVS
jgi:hypothetical protein